MPNTHQTSNTTFGRPDATSLALFPPGCNEWAMQKRLANSSFVSNAHRDPEAYWENLSEEEREKLTAHLATRRLPNIKNKANQALVFNISNWTNGNGWMMVDGGEHDGKWVNPKYNDIVFLTGRLYDNVLEENVYFPLGDSSNDPLGLACHYEISVGADYMFIQPNKWTSMGDTRQYRRKRARKRKKARKKYLRRIGMDTDDQTAVNCETN
jgi:hypothetical protein